MSLTHKITQNISYSGTGVGTLSISASSEQTAGQFVEVNESIPDASTDLEVALELDVTQMKLLLISADGAITIETNSGSTPADTILVDTSNPKIWFDGQLGVSNPFTTDVTALFVTNASGAAVQLKLRALVDPTV